MKKIYISSLAIFLILASPIMLVSQTLSLDAFLRKDIAVMSQYDAEVLLDFPSFNKDGFTYMMLPLKEDSWITVQEVTAASLRAHAPAHLWQVVSKEGRYQLHTHMHALDDMPLVSHPENLRSLGSPHVGIALRYSMK
ncbi:MAG: hypothetical protein AAF824_10990 [Bacteroidota bacterium]